MTRYNLEEWICFEKQNNLYVMVYPNKEVLVRIGLVIPTNVWNQRWLVLDLITKDEDGDSKLEADRRQMLCVLPEDFKVTKS